MENALSDTYIEVFDCDIFASSRKEIEYRCANRLLNIKNTQKHYN